MRGMPSSRPRAPRSSRDTFAARAGRWSAAHRRTAILGWLAFVVLAVLAGSLTGTNTPDQSSYVGESGRAERVADRAFPERDTEQVLLAGPGGIEGPRVRSAVRDLAAQLERTPAVDEVSSPLDRGSEALVSRDGRSVLVSFTLTGDPDDAGAAVAPIERDVRALAARHPGVEIGQFGDASAGNALDESFEEDFRRAETLSIPITLLILVFAFGALVAAGIPLVLALTAVAATLGLIGPLSQLVPVDETISSIVLLVGLAVGVDYTLFYLRREREERRAGRTHEEAVQRAAATSGRAVLVSGLTVIAAMGGMLLAGDPTFTALGIGSMLVVGVAMLGSVTVVPAVLAALGPKVDRGRIPFLGKALERRAARAGTGGRAWSAVLDRVLRRPALSAVASAGVLVALAVPALGMHTANTGTDDLSRDLEVMRTYDRMQAAFPGGQIPARVVLRADDVTTPAATAAIAELGRAAQASGRLGGIDDVAVSADRRVASVALPVEGDGADEASVASLRTLRETVIPGTVGRSDAVEVVGVTGTTAESEDFTDLMKARAPLVFGFVLTLAFGLLLVTFRSVVIPIKAIVLNLLSVGASYGVLVWVFQWGNLERLLGFTSNGAITSWLPMFLFVILFGLSMDYHVFILSRVREAVDGGLPTDRAVSHAIRATAGTVTSAAVVMVAVFAIFATLSAIDFKQMGVGLAVAILLDATLVRAVLLPASMKLLGEWNWYLPRWLEWLPQVAHEPAPGPAPRGRRRARPRPSRRDQPGTGAVGERC
jgi:RND superfamily putative drug exporter